MGEIVERVGDSDVSDEGGGGWSRETRVHAGVRVPGGGTRLRYTDSLTVTSMDRSRSTVHKTVEYDKTRPIGKE